MNAIKLSLVLLAGVISAYSQNGGWVTASSKSFGFTVSMPGQPTREPSVPVKLREGTVYVHRFDYKSRAAVYIAAFAEAPAGTRPNPTEQEILRARDKLISDSQGTVLSQRRFSFAGKQVLELVIERREGVTFILRIFMGDRRAYFLAAATPKGMEDNPDIQRYFASFRFLGKSGKR